MKTPTGVIARALIATSPARTYGVQNPQKQKDREQRNYAPSYFVGSPCRSLEDERWKDSLSYDLSVHFSSNLVSLDQSPVQKCGSWRPAFSVHVYTCCELLPPVCDFPQVIFHRTLVFYCDQQ